MTLEGAHRFRRSRDVGCFHRPACYRGSGLYERWDASEGYCNREFRRCQTDLRVISIRKERYSHTMWKKDQANRERVDEFDLLVGGFLKWVQFGERVQ